MSGETLRDVLAEMRESDRTRGPCYAKDWADRIERASAQGGEGVNESMSVPRRFVGHVLALAHNWKLEPIPPEWCTDPGAQYWFKEAYRRCGRDLAEAKAMLERDAARTQEPRR